MIEFIRDTLDKPSSKRIAGLFCIGVGLIISLLIVILDASGAGLSTQLVELVLTSLFSSGTLLLGAGVIEKFSKRKMNDKHRNIK